MSEKINERVIQLVIIETASLVKDRVARYVQIGQSMRTDTWETKEVLREPLVAKKGHQTAQ